MSLAIRVVDLCLCMMSHNCVHAVCTVCKPVFVKHESCMYKVYIQSAVKQLFKCVYSHCTKCQCCETKVVVECSSYPDITGFAVIFLENVLNYVLVIDDGSQPSKC